MQAASFLQELTAQTVLNIESAEQALSSQKALLVPLTHLAFQSLSGEDASSFLQGQLSSDIRAVTPESCQYSSYSTPKGRMLASFLILKKGEEFYLQTSADIMQAVFKRLNMFILRSKVRSVPADIAAFGVVGPHAGQVLQHLYGSHLASDQMVLLQEDGLLIVRHSAEQYQLIGDENVLRAAYLRIQKESFLVGAEFWDAADIQAGYPRITAATQEAFVPQMANMDLIGAVSFKKGCYPGQEIVARTQYLGKLKKRAYRAQIHTHELVKNGDAVYSAALGEQSCGMIALAASRQIGVWDVLVVVQQSCVAQDVYWGNLTGEKLHFNLDDLNRLAPIEIE